MVADPGVMDVSTSWTDHLPKGMTKALDEGNTGRFDRDMAIGTRLSPKNRRTLAFRMRPYGTDDPYEAYRAVREYHLRDAVGRIECPVLITDPEDEQFWPGQAEQLRAALSAPATLVGFSADEGPTGTASR